jgi:hypothetical protein
MPEDNPIPPDSFEVVRPDAIESLARAEINQLIATARRYPREIDNRKITERMVKMATYTEAAASECFYAIPRGGTIIYGPSVRLSEVASYCWGNMHSVARVVNVDKIGRTVTSQAVAWDLEANVQEAVEYTNRITIGGDDGVKTAALAAISLAKRNAKFALIPRVVWWPVFQKCMDVAVGSAVPIGAQIIEMQKAFSRYGIVLEQIMEKLGRTHPGDITEDDILKLRGFYVAIKENEAQAGDIFPPISRPVAATSGHDAEPVPEAAGPRRRGRPPGSRQAVPVSSPEPQKQETAPTPEPENVSQFPTGPAEQQESPDAPQDDFKLNIINKLKALLERDGKSEAGLLAKMREWSIDKDLATQPINLEDYRDNSLVQIVERWDHLSTHFK